MLKICPQCKRTFSGGRLCLHCSDEVALLDVADPSVRRAHLRSDGELKVTIRTYYGARSAMLMLFVGILFGMAFAVVMLRKASSVVPSERWPWLVAAGVFLVGLPSVTAFVGARVVHRFSKSCRRRPLQARELRVVRH